jgi:hypothetical protein
VLFDENMRYVEDWDLWLRMSQRGCPMAWLEEIVCCYRIHAGAMVRHAELMKAGMITMLDKLYSQPDLPAEIIALRNQAYANVYLNAAARFYAIGAEDEGKSCLATAVRLDPALLEQDPPRVYSSLASFALTPLVEDSEAYIDALFSNLPVDAGLPDWSPRRARGLVWAVAAFEAMQRQQYGAAVRNAFSAARHDMRWLRHKGLLSISRQAVMHTIRDVRSSGRKAA